MVKKKEDINKRYFEEEIDFWYVIVMFMFEKEYKVVLYFGDKCIWFKEILNIVKYVDGFFCINELNVDVG